MDIYHIHHHYTQVYKYLMEARECLMLVQHVGRDEDPFAQQTCFLAPVCHPGGVCHCCFLLIFFNFCYYFVIVVILSFFDDFFKQIFAIN